MPELSIMSSAPSGNSPVAVRPASSSRRQEDAEGFAITLLASMSTACEVQVAVENPATAGTRDHQEPNEASEFDSLTGDMNIDVSTLLGIPLTPPPVENTATLLASGTGVDAGDLRVGPGKPRAGTSGSQADMAGLEIAESVTTALTAVDRRAGPDRPIAGAPEAPVGPVGLEITEPVTAALTAGARGVGPDKPRTGATGSPARVDWPEATEPVPQAVADEAGLLVAGEEARQGMTTNRQVAGVTGLLEHGKRGQSTADANLALQYEGKNGQSLQNSIAQPPGPARYPELRAAVDISQSSDMNASGTGMGQATIAGDRVRMEPAATRFVAAHVESPTWSKDFGQNVIRLATEGQRIAEIHLNPPDWGPIHVSLKLDGDDATVRMFAEHSGTREALAGAIPHLRELFETSGLKIVDAAVNANNQSFASSGSGSHSFTPSSQQTTTAALLSVDESLGETAISPDGKLSRSTDRMVDLFA